MPTSDPTYQVVLLRHGKTKGYSSDLGLSELGVAQARDRGTALAAFARSGAVVTFPHAPTARARETASAARNAFEHALDPDRRSTVLIHDPTPEPLLDNIRLLWDGELVATTDIVAERAALGQHTDADPLPCWAVESDRFWTNDGDTPDPVTFWLTTPTLSFEPPAVMVARMWRGIRKVAAAGPHGLFVIACTHSACLRALSATTFGYDLGEPEYLEPLWITLQPNGTTACVGFRGAEATVQIPHTTPPWINPAWLSPELDASEAHRCL